MIKDIYIVGASGFGREVAWLIEELNEWNIVGFIDDNVKLKDTYINGIKVVGPTDYLMNLKKNTCVVVAIGKSSIREMVVHKLKENQNIVFPNIIAKDVRISNTNILGEGNIICSHSVLTVNINLGNFNHVNLDCTIGHDVEIKDYVTVYPSVNVSGNVNIGNKCEIGTGTQVIQGLNIFENSIVGAGAIVCKDICESGTYVGIPAKKIK